MSPFCAREEPGLEFRSHYGEIFEELDRALQQHSPQSQVNDFMVFLVMSRVHFSRTEGIIIGRGSLPEPKFLDWSIANGIFSLGSAPLHTCTLFRIHLPPAQMRPSWQSLVGLRRTKSFALPRRQRKKPNESNHGLPRCAAEGNPPHLTWPTHLPGWKEKRFQLAEAIQLQFTYNNFIMIKLTRTQNGQKKKK